MVEFVSGARGSHSVRICKWGQEGASVRICKWRQEGATVLEFVSGWARGSHCD